MASDLEKRVMQFQLMELPGQPMSMHMGTYNLVVDLLDEIKRLRACTNRVGADSLSEDDIIALGMHFGDYEKGFNEAIEIITRRMDA